MKPVKAKLNKSQTILNWVAIFCWTLGFGLAFIIPGKSRYIFIPDTLLLIGFWPLLFQWRFSLPWIIFGCSNMGIGFILQLSAFLPNEHFTAAMILVKEHLANLHSPITWIVIGFISALYGVGRFIKNLGIWLIKKFSKTPVKLE